ncbi:hypothetical protein GGI12_000107 [Dipsacomyces acuminosporus]|nr:hypothetical protein GGI12_000107 [Dipsacomyces acuminosporus]
MSTSPPTSTSMKTTAAALDTMDLTTAGIPTASSSSGNTSSANLLTMPASGELDVGMVDQDLSMYLQFLQSLTSDQIDLCLDGSTNAGLHSAGNGQDPNAWSSILSDIGSNGMAATSSPAATVPAAGVPSSLLAIPSSQATGLAGAMAKAQQNMDVDEDDAADGDFVLEEEDMDDDYDDDEADDDDDDEEEGDAEAYGRCVNGEAGESKPSTHHSSSGTALSTLHAGGYPAQQGSSQSVQPLAWDYALNQLGFSSDASIAIGTTEHGSPNAGAMSAISVSGNTGSTSLLAPDPLIQQLMQGVADMSKHGEGGSADTEHSIWKPNAANTAMLPEWNSGATSGIGSSIDRVKSNQKGTTRSLGKQAGKKAAQLHPSGPGPGPASARTPKKLSKSSSAIESPSSKAAAKQQQSMQQRASGDGGTPLKRGMLKTPRKRKKVTSESIAQVLSAAVKGDTDSLLIGEQNGIDFEMSGLYQDALQEGEEIDVQEESLVADNSDFLFTSEQMSQLREQQVQNFQFVTQAFLISCAESGPHGQRARHWKKQLDQLALWHSLGTRESPSDLMSKDGLKQFGTLIESAERMRARTGTVGVTEYGRFVPNPASFFAIPGITAVIPDIYEAVDEIHRVTQLPAEHDGKGSEGSTSSSDSKAEYFIGMLGNTSMIHGSSNAGAETRSFDGSMDFTPKCCCTPTRGFKSALMIECVFPRLYLEMRNVKRKASDAIVEGEVKAADAGSRHQAILPASSRNEGGGSKQARHTNSKPAAPQARPISRQLSAPAGKGRGDGTAGSGLPAIMPSLVCESPPTYKQSDIRILVDEMRSQMRSFKRDIHRVPRNRRRIFVQGEDGVPRLEWMKVKIEPLPLPLAMQCLLAPMVSYCGFRESMLPNIVAVRKPKNRIHFLESEDTLLLHGLKLFGIEDVASMRVHLMPCKTASQLRNRMNNLRARRAPPNPVKDFCLRRIAPFTLEEEEILRVGVVAYGDEFKQVNQNFLVNRPIIALTRVWNHLRNPDKAA